MIRFLVPVLNGLFALVSFLLLTGGTILHFGRAKIEFSTLDLWALLFVASVWAVRRWNPRGFEKSWPALAWNWITDAKNSQTWAWRVCVFFFAMIFLAHGVKHLGFETHLWDMVPVHQGLFNPWPTAKTRVFACDACIGLSTLGEHLTFSFFLLAPFTWILKSDTFIFLVQVLILGFPLYYAIRTRLEPKLWLTVLLIFLCQRTLRNAGIWDFREDDLAYFGLFFMILGFHRQNWLVFFSSLVLALLSKENIFAVTLVFSVSILLSRESGVDRRRRVQVAAAVALISLFYAWLSFKVLIPKFVGIAGAQHPISARLSTFGKTPGEILLRVFTEPGRLFGLIYQLIVTPDALKYLVFLLGPVAFFFRSREAFVWLIPATAGIAMNLISSASTQRMLQFHYDLIIVPFLVWAAMLGIRDLMKSPARGKPVLAVGLLIALCFSGRWPGFTITHSWPETGEARAAHAFSTLQGDEPTASNASIAAHLTHLPRLTTMNAPFGDPAKPFWTKLLNLNPKTDPRDRGRSLREASRVVLDTHEDWERDFLKELLSKNGKVEMAIPGDANDPRWVVVRLPKPIGQL
ncbi:MAG: DUF2079 domain-containing protein [Bdellovibrionales bacterium]|nr:DUF2079 domain-containing protein [Bdellovibrionales bacterium]